jgi:hypothetical protein
VKLNDFHSLAFYAVDNIFIENAKLLDSPDR